MFVIRLKAIPCRNVSPSGKRAKGSTVCLFVRDLIRWRLFTELMNLVFQFNSSLQSLNLEHNNITGEGVKQLAASLQAAEGGGLALRSLNLRGNPLEDAGGMAIADMLKVRFF